MASSHCARYCIAALIFATFLLLIPLGSAVAQTTNLQYNGDGVFPRHCSLNSQRWFRCDTDPGSATTTLVRLYLSGVIGGPFNPSNCLQDRSLYTAATNYEPRADNLDGVAKRYPGGRRIIWTIGPYTGLTPHQNWCMGNFYQTGSGGARFTFSARYQPASGDPVNHSRSENYFSHYDDSDRLEWFQSPALGVDPLEATPNQIDPDNDNGSGDSTFKFRVQYANALPASSTFNLPPRWGADNGVYGETGTYIDFDLLPKAAPTAADAPYAYQRGDYGVDWDWTIGDNDDPWYDQTPNYSALTTPKGAIPAGYSGYRDYEMRVEVEVVLILDGNTNRPHFMLREDPNDNTFTDGVIYHYEIQPTDYMNFLDPMFQFRYDPPGHDEQDWWACGVHGTPTSNGFVSLARGGHTYEFWATDDWHPPRGVAHVQVGWPGNQMRAEYIHPFWAYRWYWEREYQYTRQVRPYGYPYDCQDPNRYPEVNPVLSAFPYFPEGGVASWRAVGGEPRLVPTIEYEVFNDITKTYDPFPVISPFESVPPEGGPAGAIVGGRPNQPTHYINDDTIRPNYANIWDQNPVDPNATPLRGGKWTSSTTFTFLVNYWRNPNRSPDFIRVMVRKNNRGSAPTAWRGFTMEQLNPTDTDYTDGAVFRYQISADQLAGGGGPGDYNYYFVASDGSRSTIFPNRPPRFRDTVSGFQLNDRDPLLPASNPQADFGVPESSAGDNDYYYFRVNNAPVLSNNSVEPASARTGSNFVYQVTYTDPDGEVLNAAPRGDEPFTASIVIDLFGDPQGENRVVSVSPGSINYSTETGPGYALNSLVSATRPFYLRIEEAANTNAVGLTYQITANDPTTIWATPIPPAVGFGTDPISPGDRFEIVQWFTGTMSRTNPSDNNATDGIAYEFNSANLITLGPGLHRYHFVFRDDWGDWAYPDDLNVSVEGERVRFPQTSEFEGPEVLANTAPTLTNYRFTPDAPTGPDGTTATEFVFFVTYTDMENGPPAIIRLGIDGTADTPDTVLDMAPSDPNDDVYSDGAVYETPPIRLDAGTHIFRAQATDGELTYPPKASPSDPLKFCGPPNPAPPPPRLDNVDGPYVAQNTPPILEFEVQDAPPAAPSPGLDPDAGTQQDTYTYTIIYKDLDVYAGVQGNPPEWVRVYIDGAATPMQPVDPTDRDYTDGCTYQTQVTGLVAGTAHTYYFYTSDGLDTARQPPRTATPNTFPGPRVDQPPGEAKSLVVSDVPGDQGGAIEGNFNPSIDDGGGAQDVTEYRVYYDMAGTMASPILAVTVVAEGKGAYPFTHNTAPKATDLWYMVRAFDGTNESIDSNIAGPVRATDNIPPDAPTGLIATNPGAGGRLDLTWSKSADDPSAGADDVTEYHLYRATFPMGYTTMLAQTPAGTTSHQDMTVLDGVDYYYVVRAWDGENESGNSNEAGPVQSSDTAGPVLSDFDPAPGAQNVPVDTDIAFTATDTGAGVDPSTLVLNVTVAGQTVTGLEKSTSVTYGYRFTFEPTNDFNQLDVVNVKIEISDLAVPVAQKTTRRYRFTVSPPPTYSVSGTIMEDNGSGTLVPVPNVTVYAGVLSGTTDGTGQYTVTGLTNGSYEVRPQRSGKAFVPSSRNVTIADADVPGVDFTAVPGYNTRGRVTDSTGAGIPNVQVSNGITTATTAADGAYVIKNSPAGTYVVRPSLPGQVFTPTQRVVTLPDPSTGGPANGVNFRAAPETFTIGGTVSTADGGRLSDALVTAETGGVRAASARTDSNGSYLLRGLVAGTYTVAATQSGFSFEPATLEVTVGPNAINNDFVAFELFTQSYNAGLAFLAFPVDPANDDIVAALGTDRIARWDPTRATADKYVFAAIQPNASVLDLTPGRGYFVSFTQPQTVQIPGRLLRTSDPFSLPLDAGFNMAGNPYPISCDWSNLAITSTGPVADFGFILIPGSRTYDLVSDIPELGGRPDVPGGAGFWIEANAPTVLSINAPQIAAAEASAAPAPKVDDKNWVIPVVAAAPGAADRSSRAGVLELATTDAAAFQVSNPPAQSGTVDLYFLGQGGKPLACDIRPATAAGGVWEFAVSTDLQNVPVTVSLPDLSSVPANMKVTLVDLAAHKRIYARTLTGHTYSSGQGGERRFRLEIEPDRGGNLVITAASAQPAGQGVAVSYSVSKRASMRIVVRNISGLEVATIARSQDVEAGRNSALWNLQSNRGTKVPAGQYLIVLEATAEDGQKVQALQRVPVNR